jgi:hypothetical protein
MRPGFQGRSKWKGAQKPEVQPLAGGIGREEDTEGILRGIGVEAALDLLAPGARGQAIDHLDPLLGAVCLLDGRLEHGLQVALCSLAVLREDRARRSTGRRALGLLAGSSGHRFAGSDGQTGLRRAGVAFGGLLHPVEKGPPPESACAVASR